MDPVLRSLFEHASVGMSRVDCDGRYLEVNARLCELLGFSAEELVCRRFSDFLHTDEAVQALEAFRRLLYGEERSLQAKRRYVAKTGELRILLSSTILVRDHEGKVDCFFETYEDVTPLATMAVYGNFVRALVHESNNRLTVIRGQATILEMLHARKTLTSDQVLAGILKIKSTSELISDVVRTLRSLVYEENGEPLRTVRLREIVENVLILCRDRFKACGVSLEVKSTVDPELAIRCRVLLVEQVILGLMLASLEAVKNVDAPWVKFEIECCDAEMVIAIADNRCKVEDEVRKAILSPSFGDKRVEQGASLGLWIASTLVAFNRGSLTLDEQLSQARFVVRFPWGGAVGKSAGASSKNSGGRLAAWLAVAATSLGLTLARPTLAYAMAVDTIEPAKLQSVAESKYWRRLIHYRPSFPFGALKSQVDGPEFFFASDGKTNPLAELKATINAFERDVRVGRLKQHPQCSFPERYRYLKQELKLEIKDVRCEKLEEFLGRFHAQSATLVFSSSYPNNPGSMFGHTFLRINSSSGDAGKNDLLDYGISFAAVVPPEDGGLVFAVLGLSGGYIGQFGMVPYYAKVNEYSNSESRDLWEYDLNLNAEEAHRMLLHAWEIETNSWFDYYFFDENCAYVLLTLLEVARPELELSRFGIYVIPGETVKRVVQAPGLVRAVKFRPSLRKRLYQKLASLNAGQRNGFFDVLRGSISAAAVKDPSVLESVTSYLYYVKQRDDQKLSENDSAILRASLVGRAELGGSSEGSGVEASLPAIREDSRPDLGHETYRIGTSAGAQSIGFFQELDFKFAFHDLLNDDTGYTRFSQIDFPGATLRFIPKTGVLNVERISGLALTSLYPMTFIEKKPSYRFNFDYYSPKDYGCVTCHLFRGEAGAGAAAELFSPDYIGYILGSMDVEAGDSLRKGFRFGPKATVATILNPVSRYKLQLAVNLVTDLAQDDRRKAFTQLEWNQSLALGPEWDVRTSTLYMNNYKEGKVTLNHYF